MPGVTSCGRMCTRVQSVFCQWRPVRDQFSPQLVGDKGYHSQPVDSLPWLENVSDLAGELLTHLSMDSCHSCSGKTGFPVEPQLKIDMIGPKTLIDCGLWAVRRNT